MHVVGALALIFVPALFVAEQPDLGTAILIAASGLFVLLLAGLGWRYIVAAVAVVAAAAYPMWQFVLHDYQRKRMLTLLNPEADKLGAGWNIIQSKTAIGSGGLDGKGWLQGTQSHLDFLPEGHTDFIIAVLSEEWGLRGVLVLLALYIALIARGVVDRRARAALFRASAGGVDRADLFCLCLRQHGHGGRAVAGGGRAAAADQSGRHRAGDAVCRVRPADGDRDRAAHSDAIESGAMRRSFGWQLGGIWMACRKRKIVRGLRMLMKRKLFGRTI